MKSDKVNANKRLKVFFDTEFTGLRKDTDIMSIGFITEDGRTFYAEFTDYDPKKLNAWLIDNIVSKMKYVNSGYEEIKNYSPSKNEYVGDKKYVADNLKLWLTSLYNNVEFENCLEMWSDCLAYDWVLFCDLFGGARSIPKSIYYIPFDICTLMPMAGIDPDITRDSLSKTTKTLQRHNALGDARMIKVWYHVCMSELFIKGINIEYTPHTSAKVYSTISPNIGAE